jgi:hypothetical protein
MTIFEDLYNWLAQRNIGEMIGLRWDPDKDKKYQRARLIRNAESMREWVVEAEMKLAQGNIPQAGFAAHRILQSLPDAKLPITSEVLARAKAIIAQLPADFVPPPPVPKIPADQALAKIARAADLLSQDKIEEAKSVLDEVVLREYVSTPTVHSREVAIPLLAVIAILNRKSPPRPSRISR